MTPTEGCIVDSSRRLIRSKRFAGRSLQSCSGPAIFPAEFESPDRCAKRGRHPTPNYSRSGNRNGSVFRTLAGRPAGSAGALNRSSRRLIMRYYLVTRRAPGGAYQRAFHRAARANSPWANRVFTTTTPCFPRIFRHGGSVAIKGVMRISPCNSPCLPCIYGFLKDLLIFHRVLPTW